MPDLDRDPETLSTHGHTEPVSAYHGTAPLEPGLKITVGPNDQQWEVLRIDQPDGDDVEAVFHIHRP